MRILNAGTEQLSNADVLHWIQDKRKEYKHEDDADRQKGQRQIPRPKDIMKVLKQHEEVLSSKHYPYIKNPSVYGINGASRYDSLREFDRLVCERVVFPVRNRLTAQLAASGLTKEQMEKRIEQEQEMKTLSEAELLMIYNHAPIETEMMQPMIDSVEERFNQQEQELLVEIISQVFRKDEEKAKAAA